MRNHSKKLVDLCDRAFCEIGFKKRSRGILYTPLRENVLGLLHLDALEYGGQFVEIAVFLGVAYERMERNYARGHGRRYAKGIDSTTRWHLMTEAPLHFEETQSPKDAAARVFSVVDRVYEREFEAFGNIDYLRRQFFENAEFARDEPQKVLAFRYTFDGAASAEKFYASALERVSHSQFELDSLREFWTNLKSLPSE